MLRKMRSEIMEKFHSEVANGKILVGVGAGTGITAKCSEAAGVDMLIIYNSGRFRMGRQARCQAHRQAQETIAKRSLRHQRGCRAGAEEGSQTGQGHARSHPRPVRGSL